MPSLLKLATCLMLTSTSAIAANDPAEVPVTRVVLFSSGVGYFEHAATVEGNAKTELRFKSAQINDILKSLVLEDLDGGSIGTVVYPSQDPLSKTLRSFQVDISANPPLAQLLYQVRGAQVTVTIHSETITGTILGVEQRMVPAGDKGQTVPVALLNLIAQGTIRAIRLDEVTKLELVDAELQEELGKALAALAQARDQDKKPVAINFSGQGQRRVRMGYVVETPVWKTSYRLVLPETEGDKAYLQGWAIVENQTDSDWSNVALSLVSGRPISFIQDMYTPLYVPRPVVQPELYASLSPQTYGKGIETVDESTVERFQDRRGGAMGGMGGGMGGMGGGSPFAGEPRAPAAKAQRGAALLDSLARAGRPMAAAEEYDSEGVAVMSGIQLAASVASAATAEDIGELFQYTVGSVTLPRQQSAMIPIVTDEIEAERVSIYNASVLANNPLNGARLKNTTGKHLLNGPVTIFDGGGYGGDARIDNIPPEQNRLLSYAIDLKVHVSAANRKDASSLLTGKIVKGVLQLTHKWTSSQEYLVENNADADRVVLIEHSRRSDWKLVNTPEPVETTDHLYRFEDTIAAAKKSKLLVQEENVRSESVTILNADISALAHYSRQGEIPDKVREVLTKAIQLKNALVDTEREINQRREKIAEITNEQNRIRSNMNTVNKNSDYYNRLLSKLNDQETDIEQLQSQIGELEEKMQQQRAELEDFLANTTVG